LITLNWTLTNLQRKAINKKYLNFLKNIFETQLQSDWQLAMAVQTEACIEARPN